MHIPQYAIYVSVAIGGIYIYIYYNWIDQYFVLIAVNMLSDMDILVVGDINSPFLAYTTSGHSQSWWHDWRNQSSS